MEETNKQILLPAKKFWNAEEEDLTVRVGLENSDKLLRLGEKDIVLDIAQLYDSERESSTKYKIYGKLKMVFRNLYTGTTTYTHLQHNLYLNNDGSLDSDYTSGSISYDEFAFLRKDVLREIIDPTSVSGNTISSFTPTLVATGYTGHTTITPINAPYQNWNLYLSYVDSHETGYTMNYTLSGGTSFNFVAGHGIPFRVDGTSRPKYYILTSPVPHGFNMGDYILLSGGTCSYTNYTGSTYYVNEIGNEIFNSKDYVLVISKSQFTQDTTVEGSLVVLGKRVVDINNIIGSTSQYYVHQHKTLTDTSGYIMDNVGFEKPIWEEERKLLFQNVNGIENHLVEQNRMESVLYDFKEPIDISGLTNNMGFQPTELYVTTILRNKNGYFNYPPKVGFKFNFHDTWIDEHFDNGNIPFEKGMTGNTYTLQPNVPVNGYTNFTGGTELLTGTTLIGAFVEYNMKDVKERIISESYHKFTMPLNIFNYGQTGDVDGFSGATASNPFGYYYQPHHRVKLRQLSPYIESAITNDIYNLPENTIFDPYDNIWRWRDIYTHGFIDDQGYGTNFPFLNGQHYVMNSIDFYLRNEKYYLNKADGFIDFNDTINKNINPLC